MSYRFELRFGGSPVPHRRINYSLRGVSVAHRAPFLGVRSLIHFPNGGTEVRLLPQLEAFFVTCQTLKHRCALAVFSLILVTAAFSAPPVTTIDDTLYKADGTLFHGILMINWRSFEGPDTSNIPTNSLTTRVVNGRLFVKLVPTTTAPTATYYSVRYVADGSVQFTELWSVPPSSASLRVRDVRIVWPPSTTVSAANEDSITIDDVEGLRDALDSRPEKGTSYTPSRTAVIGPTGNLEAAGGDVDNCVRVNGTSTPCGAGSFVDGETPSGTIDGSNSSFTLSGTPTPSASLLLYRNGLLQKQSLDYTLSGGTVSFTASAVPQTGDVLTAFYRVDSTLTASFGFVDAETPSGTVDGSNSSFTLSETPSPSASLRLYRNGLLQKASVDYELTGNTINFLSVSIPQSGDILQASYRTGGN